MSEHTEAGKECIARVVHELVPTIERDFWQDDPHNGDVRQHLYFWIEGEPDAYRIAFMSSSLNECAHPHNTTEQTLLSRLLEIAVSLLVLTLGFSLLFKYVPDAEIRWHDVWLGGVMTAVLFTVGKTAIGYYLGYASVGSAYGAAGSMVVLLVWVYYSALIMFFGAEFTHTWATREGAVTPQPHAVSGAAPQTKSEAAAERPPRS